MQAPKCSNCGKRGHSVKFCQDPVMSYGIIAIRVKGIDGKAISFNSLMQTSRSTFEGISSIGKIEYLMIQRKDSLAFVEFVRGKYSLDDIPYLRKMMTNMTDDERGRLGIEFDDLWKSVWGELPVRSHKHDYENSKEKYNIMMENGLLKVLLEETRSEFVEPEWGFPKGRRNPGEDDIICAMREFYEETGLTKNSYSLLKFMDPLEESFFGTNRIHYSHKYYLAICASDQEVQLNENNHHMCREIGNIGWFSLEEALSKIRSENVEKREMLFRVQSVFRNYMPINIEYRQQI
jgi:8-oxo-dGTP pyrophosphatase MutT (NUDIX family)